MSGFIMQPENIEKIIAGTKTMTRRLVKEREVANYNMTLKIHAIQKYLGKELAWTLDETPKFRTKYQVGKSVEVQPGRGKWAVWYCLSCKKIREEIDCARNAKKKLHCINCLCDEKNVESELNLLRIRIISIRKEKLLDIDEAEAKKEGFEDKKDFLLTFYNINKKIKAHMTRESIRKMRKEDINIPIPKTEKYFFIENPEVWRIEFEVVK